MSDPIARLNTALEGRYAIELELGEGGMATVYLADDLKLRKPGKDIKPCRASSYRVEPAGIEPATSGLQSQRSPN